MKFVIVADDVEVDEVEAGSPKQAMSIWLEMNCLESIDHAKKELPAETLRVEHV